MKGWRCNVTISLRLVEDNYANGSEAEVRVNLFYFIEMRFHDSGRQQRPDPHESGLS